MIDIVIPSLYGVNRLQGRKTGSRKKVLRGRVVSARCARLKVDPLRPRKTDKPFSKTLIVIVEDFKPLNSLVNRDIEIRILDK